MDRRRRRPTLVWLTAAWAVVAAGRAGAQIVPKNCVKKSISGRVTKGQLFRAAMRRTLEFRLKPADDLGWIVEVGPPGVDDLAIVTPPYHFNDNISIAMEYGHTAREVVRTTPREFAFVLNQIDLERAKKAVDLMIYGRGDKDLEEGSGVMSALRVGSLHVSILDSKVEDEPTPGIIEWIRFRADACVPK